MDELSQFRVEFIQNAGFRLEESLRMIRLALDEVSEAELWHKPNAALNSIGNLLLHICGNMTQYGIASLKETKDHRNRDAEFSQDGGLTKEQVLQKLEQTVEETKATLQHISTQRLLQHKEVQGFDFSGVGNIIHAVEHFSYHTGQIAFWVKLMHNKQLGFYDGINLNIKNQD